MDQILLLDEVRVRVELRQEDPGWVFRVPSLNIFGGAPTREVALQRCFEAIRFALEAPVDKKNKEVGAR